STEREDMLTRHITLKLTASINEKSTTKQMFQSFRTAAPDAEMFRENLQAIKNRLLRDHRFQLTRTDQESVDFIFKIFFDTENVFGYSASIFGGYGAIYAELMAATDEQGQARSYLATEESFRTVQDLERRNLIIPVVGDF